MRRLLLPTLLIAIAGSTALAQSRITVAPRAGMLLSSDDPDRAFLGVSTSSDGKRDTLGLLVTAVTDGSPAEKAGIEEGNRIGSINGVSLKLSRGDAGESDMSGVMSNRLVREMRKLKPGDEASIEIWANGHYKTIKVKTVAAGDLSPRRVARTDMEERAALGLSVSSNGSKRDTLGVFVSGVTEDGPAEKAGIAEGDRIANINGVDLRTAREDVGEGWSSSNRVQRLEREIAKLKPGQSVDLTVVSGGRSRTVKATAVRARDLKGYGDGFGFGFGGGAGFMSPGSTFSIPTPPRAPNPPRVRVFGGDGDMQFDMDRLREQLQRIGPEVRMQLDRELPRAMDELRLQLDRDLPRALDDMRFELKNRVPRAIDGVGRAINRVKIDAPALKSRVVRVRVI